jgi:hypothetical protein
VVFLTPLLLQARAMDIQGNCTFGNTQASTHTWVMIVAPA